MELIITLCDYASAAVFLLALPC